ncbi:hypothetical protein QBC35DRAFT_506327 [Podospora australis]|uniref:Uncharacterized protein n=1 Tax=Podospora australis TaxID=1536484 RepID=A0AAN6WMV2_9PEZI|nr:hypothetical protein QBC35DRAFT_506327 [Podospora australis]
MMGVPPPYQALPSLYSAPAKSFKTGIRTVGKRLDRKVLAFLLELSTQPGEHDIRGVLDRQVLYASSVLVFREEEVDILLFPRVVSHVVEQHQTNVLHGPVEADQVVGRARHVDGCRHAAVEASICRVVHIKPSPFHQGRRLPDLLQGRRDAPVIGVIGPWIDNRLDVADFDLVNMAEGRVIVLISRVEIIVGCCVPTGHPVFAFAES